MTKKTRQHFVPQTYLRRFSHTQNDAKFFVDTLDIETLAPKRNLSVKDICIEKDFYTIKGLDDTEKYRIEDFFNNVIEKKYPEVYKLLVVDKKKFITPEERATILVTMLSMYFRTPKLLNKAAHFVASARSNFQDNNHEKISFLNEKISLDSKYFQEVKKEFKETHRLNYIKTQMALLFEFIDFKQYDGIAVIELIGENEFITGDNPVDISNGFNFGFNLFSLENSIYITLDPKHVLFIAPQSIGSSINEIFYQKDNNTLHLTINYSVFKNAEKWIIGTKLGIDQFIQNKPYFFEPAENDHPLLLDIIRRTAIAQELASLCEKGVTDENIELLDFWKRIKDSDIYRQDIMLQEAYLKLKGVGLNI